MLILHPVCVYGISSLHFTAENVGYKEAWVLSEQICAAVGSADSGPLLFAHPSLGSQNACTYVQACSLHSYRYVCKFKDKYWQGWYGFFPLFSFLKYFIYLAVPDLIWDLQSLLWHEGSLVVCSMWDLVPWWGIEPRPPALEAQRLSYWTTREVPVFNFLFWKLSTCAKMRRTVHWAAVLTQIHHLLIFAQLFLLSL